jgi:hypothetical protein
MITVSRTNPSPWIVQVGLSGGENDNEMTWPFTSQSDAEAAYRVAVASGQFAHELRTGDTLTLVTLWRREDTTTISGEPHMHYVGVDVTGTERGGPTNDTP